MAEEREVKFSLQTSVGDLFEASTTLQRGEKLHVSSSERGMTFYISNGGEACHTPKEANNLRRD